MQEDFELIALEGTVELTACGRKEAAFAGVVASSMLLCSMCSTFHKLESRSERIRKYQFNYPAGFSGTKG